EAGFTPGLIPSRNAEWDPAFVSSPRDVNDVLDATRPALLFSPRRRKVAIWVSAALAAWLAYTVWDLVRFSSVHSSGDELRVLGMGYYLIAIVRLVVAAGIAVGVWRWANRPV